MERTSDASSSPLAVTCRVALRLQTAPPIDVPPAAPSPSPPRARLPEKALSLTVFEQLSYFEIAEALGVLPRTVMQWVGEARSALRSELRGAAVSVRSAEPGAPS